MESYLLVMLGSALGGVGRYWCTSLLTRWYGEHFPWGTLAVNILGAFVIGLVDASATGAPARQLLMAGLCGGFTTFSAFSLQTLNLVHRHEKLKAGAYVAASVTACLVSVWVGHLAGAALGRTWL